MLQNKELSKRCVIISAGEINDYERAKSFLRKDDYYIFCDGGLAHAKALGVKPKVVVGDFDSCKPDDFRRCSEYIIPPEVIRLPREKDDTDTRFAVKLALERGFDDFLLLGSMGKRFDHALGNISVLLFLDELGNTAFIADDYSVMQIVGKNPFLIEEKCSYFSVLTVAGNVSGVTIKNAKYPVQNVSLTCDFQLGISNEVLPEKVAEVSVENGRLLVVVVK